jgi:hypothetical protein
VRAVSQTGKYVSLARKSLDGGISTSVVSSAVMVVVGIQKARLTHQIEG